MKLKVIHFHGIVAAAFLFAGRPVFPAASNQIDGAAVRAEVIVYGGTPGGVMTAVAAARHGHTVALVDINQHVGGVVSGGLVSTDIGDRKTVGGLADEFFKRVGKYYGDKYGTTSPQFKACRDGIIFEPHVAELVFEQMLKETGKVTLWRNHRYRAVEHDAGRITALVAEIPGQTGSNVTRTFNGDVFVDASYEGDLMAGAHVPCRVGRESRAEFGEYLAGISAGPRELRGLGDHRTMAYNYRVCVTSNTANRVLFPKPENYDPEPFRRTDGERARKGTATGFGSFFTTVEKAGPNGTYDANWCDFPGNSEGYAEGSWETRARLAARERDYFLSRLYYLQNGEDLPEAFRTATRTWGLSKDEFADNGHFPFQLYVREARRMVGRYVLRENDLTQDRFKPDGICAGSYGVDCHTIQYLMHDGKLDLDHTRHVAVHNYAIPYASLTPFEPGNLLVPVCLSATHVAYCSLRMEPVFMMLGHAAGDAAHLSIVGKTTVQAVPVEQLRELLRQEQAILDSNYQPPVTIVWTPAHPKVGELVKFSVQTGVLKEALKRVWWDFAGNGTVSAQGNQVEHRFTLDKVYSVSLLVEDAAGNRRLIPAEVPVGLATARDLTMDDFDAELFGRWNAAYPEIILGPGQRLPDVFFGPGVNYDVVYKGKKAPARARFQPAIPRSGRYEVCLGFRTARNQATNVPVLVRCGSGSKKLTVDQRKETTPFNFNSLGEFQWQAGDSGFVEVTNGNTDGRVAIDGVRWVWIGE
ncbi:MAG: FAD-dependent oxidoreductase [Verrucomicrobiota bacterium]